MQYIFKHGVRIQILFRTAECEFVAKDTYINPSLHQNIPKCQ